MAGIRVSQLATAAAPGTGYVIEGGVGKKIAFGTMSVQNANGVAITGGTINGTSIGSTTPSTISCSTLTASGRIQGNAEIKTTGGVSTLTPSSANMDFTGGFARFYAIGPDNATAGSVRIAVFSANASVSANVLECTTAGAKATGYLWSTTGQHLRADGSGTSLELAAAANNHNADAHLLRSKNGLTTFLTANASQINATVPYAVNGTQVLTSRRTGWGAPTGTATRTTFATGSVTLAQLAERVKALIDDFTTHGAIGA